MTTSRGNLLLDLALLVPQYPGTDWAHLAKLIEDEETRRQIVMFLKGLATLRNAFPEPNVEKKARKTPLQESNKKLLESDEIETKLARMEMKGLKQMAARLRLRTMPKESRKRLIARIMRSTGQPRPSKKKLSEAMKEETSDYGRWAKIILGKQSKGT